MDVGRSTALTGILLLLGLALIAIPVFAPPDVPDDRVEFYVEQDWMDNPEQTNLEYSNLGEDARAVFDQARRATPGTLNRSAANAPESLTPPPESITIFNVRYDGEFHLLQVRHLTYEADFVTQHLPRLGGLVAGLLFVLGTAYRLFER